ncbi:MAG TPA: hypothetical protein VE978_26295 [Chitinophagales bacterium]|nr:hypothetical protein [Chitinophagales bacterium]
MEESLRSEVLQAFLFFRKEFGNDLIKNHYYNNHPVVSAIQNKAPWSLKWLVNLHSSLKFYKGVNCNYKRILPKMLSAQYCTHEGIPFIGIADDYRKRGLNVAFEPDVLSIKKPDLEVSDIASEERIYLEVSMQIKSAQRSHDGKLYSTLIDQFLIVPPGLPFTGKMFQSFSFEELNSLCSEIHFRKQTAFENESIVSYKNEMIELFVAHPNRFSELQAIADEKNYRINNIQSLPLVIDEFERIRGRKIKEEAKQIPAESYGIIYFIIEPTYRLGYDPLDDMLNIQKKLEEFPNIIGVSIQSEWLNQGEDILIHEADILFRRKMFWNALQQETFFVINRQAASCISPEMFSKIIESFK